MKGRREVNRTSSDFPHTNTAQHHNIDSEEILSTFMVNEIVEGSVRKTRYYVLFPFCNSKHYLIHENSNLNKFISNGKTFYQSLFHDVIISSY